MKKSQKLRMAQYALRLAFVILLLPLAALADSSALILSGVPGDPDFATKFSKWTDATQKVLLENFGFSADHVIVLSDKKTTKEDINAAFARLKQQLKPLDTLFVFFIGHGSYDGDYKFNISGPDFTAAEYGQMLSSLNVGRTIIVNGTNASGGAIASLAGKNRVIVTATKGGQEINDAVFYEYFIEALKSPAADEDKDKKISVWEAFKYATDAVERFYKDDGRLATEHSQISDNGNPMTGVAVKEPPVMARVTVFQVDRPVVVADKRMQALLDERKALEQKIESLRINKDSVSVADYEKQLEDLVLQLALKNQEIKESEKK